MSFRWSVKFRLTPLNGLPKTIALDATTLPDCRGPLIIHPTYEPEDDVTEDVLRCMRGRLFGWRCRVELGFAVKSMQTQAVLAELRDALIDQETRVEMSLDGGATYREVLATGGFSPDRFNGKWTAGAAYAMTIVVKDLLAGLPRIEPNLEEFVLDGAMSEWIDSSHLTRWTWSASPNTLTRTATYYRSAPYGASMVRGAAGVACQISQQLEAPLYPGGAYTLSVWFEGGNLGYPGYRVRLQNLTGATYLQSGGASWGAGTAYCINANAGTAGVWYNYVITFTVPSTYGIADRYLLEVGPFADASIIPAVVADEVSLIGPRLFDAQGEVVTW